MQHDTIERVLKRLLSNEACLMFFQPVPLSEVDYHATVKQPISLSEIVAKVEGRTGATYASYHAFHCDVELLLSNAFLYNDDSSAFWIGACMLQKELSICAAEIKASGFDLLEPARPTSAPHGHVDQDAWGDDVEEEE